MISLVEASQAARAAGAKRGQDYAQADKRRGQWLGAATAWLAMVAAFGCVALGGTSGKSGFFWVAAAFLSVPVMAVAKSLIESAKSPSISQIPDPPGPPSDTGVSTPEDRRPS
jgi:hypothetical protein